MYRNSTAQVIADFIDTITDMFVTLLIVIALIKFIFFM